MKRENPDKPKLYRSRRGFVAYLASMIDSMIPEKKHVGHNADMDGIVAQDMARRKNEDKFPSRRKRTRRAS
jgi:hypothetical protein